MNRYGLLSSLDSTGVNITGCVTGFPGVCSAPRTMFSASPRGSFSTPYESYIQRDTPSYLTSARRIYHPSVTRMTQAKGRKPKKP